MGLRIGIDCDGVLRDNIPALIDSIKTTHPEHADKILIPKTWDWVDWLPFWTFEETEKYVFEDHYEKFFGPDCPPIDTSVEDWPKLVKWAKENDHQLILVSAQREHCKDITTEWLQRWGFMFDEIHYTKHKWSVDVDVLIDDSPEKLEQFADRSVNHGSAICYKQSWNQQCRDKGIAIDRLSDIMTRVFG